MVTGAEVTRAVYGAWRLALLDGKGLDFFEGDRRGLLEILLRRGDRRAPPTRCSWSSG